jgi:hypothetical protein
MQRFCVNLLPEIKPVLWIRELSSGSSFFTSWRIRIQGAKKMRIYPYPDSGQQRCGTEPGTGTVGTLTF